MDDERCIEQIQIPDQFEAIGGTEILRLMVIEDGRLIALVAPCAFKNRESWGIALADVARHVARGLAAEDHTLTEEQARREIVSLFMQEMQSPTDEGTTRVVDEKVH